MTVKFFMKWSAFIVLVSYYGQANALQCYVCKGCTKVDSSHIKTCGAPKTEKITMTTAAPDKVTSTISPEVPITGSESSKYTQTTGPPITTEGGLTDPKNDSLNIGNDGMTPAIMNNTESPTSQTLIQTTTSNDIPVTNVGEPSSSNPAMIDQTTMATSTNSDLTTLIPTSTTTNNNSEIIQHITQYNSTETPKTTTVASIPPFTGIFNNFPTVTNIPTGTPTVVPDTTSINTIIPVLTTATVVLSTNPNLFDTISSEISYTTEVPDTTEVSNTVTTDGGNDDTPNKINPPFNDKTTSTMVPITLPTQNPTIYYILSSTVLPNTTPTVSTTINPPNSDLTIPTTVSNDIAISTIITNPTVSDITASTSTPSSITTANPTTYGTTFAAVPNMNPSTVSKDILTTDPDMSDITTPTMLPNTISGGNPTIYDNITPISALSTFFTTNPTVYDTTPSVVSTMNPTTANDIPSTVPSVTFVTTPTEISSTIPTINSITSPNLPTENMTPTVTAQAMSASTNSVSNNAINYVFTPVNDNWLTVTDSTSETVSDMSTTTDPINDDATKVNDDSMISTMNAVTTTNTPVDMGYTTHTEIIENTDPSVNNKVTPTTNVVIKDGMTVTIAPDMITTTGFTIKDETSTENINIMNATNPTIPSNNMNFLMDLNSESAQPHVIAVREASASEFYCVFISYKDASGTTKGDYGCATNTIPKNNTCNNKTKSVSANRTLINCITCTDDLCNSSYRSSMSFVSLASVILVHFFLTYCK